MPCRSTFSHSPLTPTPFLYQSGTKDKQIGSSGASLLPTALSTLGPGSQAPWQLHSHELKKFYLRLRESHSLIFFFFSVGIRASATSLFLQFSIWYCWGIIYKQDLLGPIYCLCHSKTQTINKRTNAKHLTQKINIILYYISNVRPLSTEQDINRMMKEIYRCRPED